MNNDILLAVVMLIHQKKRIGLVILDFGKQFFVRPSVAFTRNKTGILFFGQVAFAGISRFLGALGAW